MSRRQNTVYILFFWNIFKQLVTEINFKVMLNVMTKSIYWSTYFWITMRGQAVQSLLWAFKVAPTYVVIFAIFPASAMDEDQNEHPGRTIHIPQTSCTASSCKISVPGWDLNSQWCRDRGLLWQTKTANHCINIMMISIAKMQPYTCKLII